MKYFYIFLLFLPLVTLSQSYNPLLTPNSYQSKDNPNYWKNKMPFEGYWQQDVHYQIKADINERTDIITATEKLTYTNNSKDELSFVYFHLYQEAFQPGSYAHELQRVNKENPRYGKYEQKGLGTEIASIKYNNKEVKTEQENTILKVFLDKPIQPGQSVVFDISFTTYFDGAGGVGRRFKKFSSNGYTHYDGVHWYPRICVYDRKFGWETDQHLGKEFYGDFGCYDVELTFSSNYIVEATGNLLNRDECLPADLRQKLDIKNFTKEISEIEISVIIPYDSTQRKTWRYHAENVHDFAFTADPTYRIGESDWEGVQIVSLAQEHHCHKWQNAAEYTANVIKTYSQDFGRYVYHKMVVADAQDGMEYPMLTLDGDLDPEYRGLLAHEVGHNWFFGQVGNNETYRACLDEGFTQFLTAWALNAIDGDTIVENIPNNWYERKFKDGRAVKENSVLVPYLREAIKGEDAFLNTHSDQFASATGHGGGYRQVYYKTATMLFNLQYVLGDELFTAAMKNYFNQWKITHPYIEDFRNSIIQFTKADLNWFFDQWFETKKTIDYAVTKANYGNAENEFVITFQRKGEMQMPIDFDVITKSDSVLHFHIPNNWFIKKTDAQVLPKWIGWDKIYSTYEAKVIIPNGIKEVIIDPSHRLADVNRLNNQLHKPVSYNFDSKLNHYSDPYHYEIKARPDLWYNGYDGLKLGANFSGNYMNYKHIFDGSLWINLGALQNLPSQVITTQAEGVDNEFDALSFRLKYKTGIFKYSSKTYLFGEVKMLDGLQGGNFGIEKTSETGKTNFYAYFKAMYRRDSTDLYYLINPTEWIESKWNNTWNIGLEKNYKYKGGDGYLHLGFKSSALGSEYDFSNVTFTSVHTNQIWRTKLRTRIFARYGTGSNLARESALFAAGASPEEMMDSKYSRSVGFYSDAWYGYGADVNHLQFGGGMNLRGYAGYLLPEIIDNGNELGYYYSGNGGLAVNVELDLRDIVKWKPAKLSQWFRFDTYLFADAGIINKKFNGPELDLSDLRMDAGVGTALTIKKFGPFENIQPLTIRFDMPLFLNRIPAVQTDYIAFRWLLGISRAF
jgi:hypothetical protein